MPRRAADHLSNHAAASWIIVSYRSTVVLTNTTTDQHGKPFQVQGLSGITYLGNDNYLSEMDNSDKIVRLHVAVEPNGEINTAKITGGLTIAENRDFEGIAYTGRERNSVLLAYEGTSQQPPAKTVDDFPGVREYSLADGSLIQALPVPPIFAYRRPNLAFESMALAPDHSELWTGNEESLTLDGPGSSRDAPNTIRLLRFARDGDSYIPTHPPRLRGGPLPRWPAGKPKQMFSGLSEMVELPDGRILTLERSFIMVGIIPSFQTRIYEVDFTGATDVSRFTGGLIGQTYNLVCKRLLWKGSVMNLEGLCIGSTLRNGHHLLLGVTDNNGMVPQTLVSFEMVVTKKTPSIWERVGGEAVSRRRCVELMTGL